MGESKTELTKEEMLEIIEHLDNVPIPTEGRKLWVWDEETEEIIELD